MIVPSSSLSATILASLALLSTTTSAFEIYPYRGAGCRSEALGGNKVDASKGCIKGSDAAAGTGLSAVIKTSDTSDANAFVVFFGSDDCDPDTEIDHVDESTKCFDKQTGWGSYAVWDVGGGDAGGNSDPGVGIGIGVGSGAPGAAPTIL